MYRDPTFGESNDRTDRLLGELILYVAECCADDPTFGAIKLNKILWWSDFQAFGRLGGPITGVRYVRRPQGPAPYRLLPVRNRLIRLDAAEMEERPVGQRLQERIVALRAPDKLFTQEQLDIVDEVIRDLWGMTATEVSERSHGKAWQIAAEDGVPIPYEAVFLSDEPVTDADVARTKELAEEYGW